MYFVTYRSICWNLEISKQSLRYVFFLLLFVYSLWLFELILMLLKHVTLFGIIVDIEILIKNTYQFKYFKTVCNWLHIFPHCNFRPNMCSHRIELMTLWCFCFPATRFSHKPFAQILDTSRWIAILCICIFVKCSLSIISKTYLYNR